MKKIGLFLDADPSHGGTFQYNQNILAGVAALPRDQFEVVVGYTSPDWVEHIVRHDLPTTRIPRAPLSQAGFMLWNWLHLSVGLWREASRFFHPKAKAFLREGCDLWIFPSQEDLSYQMPLPVLASIADLCHRLERRFPESASPREYRYRERKYLNICRWAKGVVVDADLVRSQVLGAYEIPAERVHVLPQVAPKYMFSSRKPRDFDRRHKLPVKYIFYPAQFWEHKNHENLLRAMADLKGELPDLKLVLAGGKKNAYDAVVSLTNDLGLAADVTFLGYVPDEDMPELYRRARALVYPTFFGPCNIPPLEALAVGCPMALSEVSSMPDRIGAATLVFDPDSVEEIANCLRRLWVDDQLCNSLSQNAKAGMLRWGQSQYNVLLCEIIRKVVCSSDR